MTRQFSTTLRNGWNDLYETLIGVSPRLQIFEGNLPVSCAAADDGVMLIDIPLPIDWMQASDQGTIAKTGSWAATVTTAGNMQYYRIKDSGSVVCHEQGLVGTTSDFPIPDLIVNTVAVELTQSISINTWQQTAPGL